MKHFTLGIASLIVLAACQQDTPEPETVSEPAPPAVTLSKAETVFADGAYTLTWSFEDALSPVDIYVTSDTSRVLVSRIFLSHLFLSRLYLALLAPQIQTRSGVRR